eukprot:TRINITY_DN19039_c0_g2_i1.p1 TRINITY_DN19039_c0_g2~~TRINITY_DN19039_c0_g2_i1.p1  ORF type:complete len:180 (+),score=33.51 TRINITY_DN19039_c0_g2_i1:52-540(+)
MAMRVVLQSVERASLLVDNVDKWVNINRGIIVYVSFLKEANREVAARAANDVLKAKIFLHVDDDCNRGRAVPALGEGWDIMVIPQATLAGKIKGKQAQYHSQFDKAEGEALYQYFCETLRNILEAEKREDSAAPPTLQCGTYGNRQGLKFESLGPFTHSLEY